MKFPVTDTATGQAQLVTLHGAGVAGVMREVTTLGLRLTVTHDSGRLSHFAIVDPVDGEFDFEMFNHEPGHTQAEPYFLASLLMRFTHERFGRWKKTRIK